MVGQAILILISCVLFIQMGLSAAFQKVLKIKIDFLSCPKCFTFWVTLITLLIKDYGIMESIAVSFISAYLALWLSLLYDYLANLYNKLYEHVSETQGTESGTLHPSGENEVP